MAGCNFGTEFHSATSTPETSHFLWRAVCFSELPSFVLCLERKTQALAGVLDRRNGNNAGFPARGRYVVMNRELVQLTFANDLPTDMADVK